MYTQSIHAWIFTFSASAIHVYFMYAHIVYGQKIMLHSECTFRKADEWNIPSYIVHWLYKSGVKSDLWPFIGYKSMPKRACNEMNKLIDQRLRQASIVT